MAYFNRYFFRVHVGDKRLKQQQLNCQSSDLRSSITVNKSITLNRAALLTRVRHVLNSFPSAGFRRGGTRSRFILRTDGSLCMGHRPGALTFKVKIYRAIKCAPHKHWKLIHGHN